MRRERWWIGCSCGWRLVECDGDSALHFTLDEAIRICPRRRWWNGMLHRVLRIHLADIDGVVL